MNKKLRLLTFLALASVSLTGCEFDLGFIKFGSSTEESSETKPEEKPQDDPNVVKDTDAFYDKAGDAVKIQSYYSSLDSSLSGTALLNALRTLNLSKRTKEIGYDTMGTSPSGCYKYTDYDPAYATTSASGIVYGTKISSFYSGISTNKFNREHVWPNSRDGNLVEDDVLMTRPTIAEENSDRGNSVYVTGMVSNTAGWDPVAAFKDKIGVYENVRGECARIIFYCMTATNSLVLNDNTNNQGSNMGKITDLVQWACENPVTYRERRRNVGAEYLQGNRNAFVDHPEYVCKVWGGTNSSTRSACQNAGYTVN